MNLLVLLVGLGGGLGAISRFLITQASANFSHQIPFGIFICNVVGSFVIGMMAAFLINTQLFNEDVSVHIRALLVTGFLGGFTTFSSFSLDILNILQRGEIFIALGYAILSVVTSLIMVVIGFYIVSFIMGRV